MLHFNSNGRSLLTARDRAELAAGRDPGDDGSGRRIVVLDEIRLAMTVPAELAPIELGWFDDADDDGQGDELAADADGIADRDRVIGELRAQLSDADETIGRVMAQRDEAIAELAELRARQGTDREAHADLLGDPSTED